MSANDVQATIVINGQYQGGTEPWARTVTLRLNGDGFLDVDGVGREGDAEAPLAPEALAVHLSASFDREALGKLFDRLAQLRKAIGP
jgi:hypothetical protein